MLVLPAILLTVWFNETSTGLDRLASVIKKFSINARKTSLLLLTSQTNIHDDWKTADLTQIQRSTRPCMRYKCTVL